MSTRNHESIQLGTLVAAAYDRAASVTSDPDRAAALTTVIVTEWLLEHGKLDLVRQLAGQPENPRTPVRTRTAPRAALPRASRRGSKRVAHALAA